MHIEMLDPRWWDSRPGRVIRFLQSLKVPDGRDAGKDLRLDDFQINILEEVYTRDENDQRIVNDAVMTMARKNGKTSLCSGLVLVHCVGPEAVKFGQLYSLAFDREQAAQVYNFALNMITQDPTLVNRLKTVDSKKTIVDPVTKSKYEALSAEYRSKHGRSTSFLIGDELAQFEGDRRLWDTLRTSVSAHGRNALAWVISTQSPNDSAVLSEMIDAGLALQETGEEKSTRTRLFFHALPVDRREAEKYGMEEKVHYVRDDDGNLTDDVDVWDPHNWAFANPGLGTIRSLEELKDYADLARRMPSMENTLRNLYCNQRIDSVSPFISYKSWTACKDGRRSLEELKGAPCYLGLDLSEKNDLTALVAIFPEERENGGPPFLDVFAWFYKPKHELLEREQTDKVPYSTWARQGYLTLVDGQVISYSYVATQVKWLMEEFDVRGMGFDRWRIKHFKRDLEAEDITEAELEMLPVGQGFQDGSVCVDAVEDAVVTASFRHGDNPVLKWCASNAVIATDPAKNRKWDKKLSRARIDGIVAVGNAQFAMQALGELGEEDDQVFILTA